MIDNTCISSLPSAIFMFGVAAMIIFDAKVSGSGISISRTTGSQDLDVNEQKMCRITQTL